MVDVAVSAQLQQWTFDRKSSIVRPERSDSSASSPDLYNDNETLRIDTAAVDPTQNLDTKETLFQERYLSSEEDLSPMELDSDDDVSIHDFEKECLSARKISISRFEKGKSCDMAVMVLYVSAGRPKMIEVPTAGSPIQNQAQRSASLAQLPLAAIDKLRKADQASRLSYTAASASSRSTSPARSIRRPSIGHLPISHNNTSLRISDSSSSLAESSSSSTKNPTRPISAAATSHPQTRTSLYVVPNASSASPLAPFPPLTPQSPEPHSFLSSDPYENSTTSAASPIIKSGPHKRLRSISQKLSLAKIAITPSTKKWDSRINGRRGTMPPTPATPYTPITPGTAATSSFSSPKSRLRRNSKISSRPVSGWGPSPEVPSVPTLSNPPESKNKLSRIVARGAGERAPTIELPPFPDDDGSDSTMGIRTRRIRKRKSLMDFTKDLM